MLNKLIKINVKDSDITHGHRHCVYNGQDYITLDGLWEIVKEQDYTIEKLNKRLSRKDDELVVIKKSVLALSGNPQLIFELFKNEPVVDYIDVFKELGFEIKLLPNELKIHQDNETLCYCYYDFIKKDVEINSVRSDTSIYEFKELLLREIGNKNFSEFIQP